MQSFLEAINERVILADGAMGTELYNRGVFFNRCYEEINLSNPELVKRVHLDYLAAGSELIETNTFGANRLKLAPHGLEDKVREINQAGVRIAREAIVTMDEGRGTRDDSSIVLAKRSSLVPRFIGASVGPLGVTLAPLGRHSKEEAREVFTEQISALVDAGTDVIVLETFMNLDELEIAVEVAKKMGTVPPTERGLSPFSTIPIIAMVSFKYYREGEFVGITPERAIRAIESWGVDIGGTNCSNGPQGVLECIQEMRQVSKMKLCAMPNAGLPQVMEGRVFYMATPEYMGEYARRLVQAGASIIGGCCGTTPNEIKEMGRFIRSVSPVRPAKVVVSARVEEEKRVTPVPIEKRSAFGAVLGKKFAVSVELDPPAGLSTSKVIEAARFIRESGVDAVNIADGPRAMARMSAMALGILVKREAGIEPIVHYCCRDRNLIGMQMDLIGANALGLNNLLIITGDPPKMGTYPMATAVFDIDSIGLIYMADQMNHGVDLSGRFLGAGTSFVIGCGCSPAAQNIDLEVERFKKKVEAGAEFVFSQPVYDPGLLEGFLNRVKDPIPFFVGILPLPSVRTAEFLHNEVPGMQIPNTIMERMRTAKTKEAQTKEGLAIAKEALAAARHMPQVKGAYICVPSGDYRIVVELLTEVRL